MYQNCGLKNWKNETSWKIYEFVGRKFKIARKVTRQKDAD